jgi:hypothetical protein
MQNRFNLLSTFASEVLYTKPQEHKTPSWDERRQLVLAYTVAQLFWNDATTAKKMKQF